MSRRVFDQIETWEAKHIKAALAEAGRDAALQAALIERYTPTLEHIGASELAALTTVVKKLTTKKPLERDWQPDPVSVEVLASVPVEKIALSKAKRFPEWLTYLVRLQALSVQECKQLSLPESVGRLAGLRELSLYKCGLREVPAAIRGLKGLKTLQLGSNEIAALPAWLVELPLEELSVSFNKLRELPAFIGELGKLTLLDVAYNELTQLPASVGELRRLSRLEVNGNKQLARLPEALAGLRSLRRLDASACALTQVPEGLQRCAALSELDVSLNPISRLPEWIGELKSMQYLKLANTEIAELPRSILQLGKLCGLDVRKSPLAERDAFRETLERKEVVSYLQRLFSAQADALVPFLRELESRDEARVRAGLEALARQPELWARAERRYLPFVQARLGDAKATLWRWGEVTISEEDEETLLRSGVQKGEYVTFLFMSGAQCRLLVDYVGAITRPHIDVARFVAECGAIASQSALMSHAQAQLERLHLAVQEAAGVYSDGWFGRLHRAFASVSIHKLMFDHTDFEAANASPVLREFYCFLSAFAATKHYCLDIFQSTPPDLTEIFWLMPLVPDTQWGDTSLTLPRSPLAFTRVARVKEGDFNGWREVPSA